MGSAAICIQVAYQIYLIKKEKFQQSVILNAFFPSLFLMLIWTSVMQDIDPKRGATREVALLTDAYVGDGFQVILGSDYALPSLPFYLKIKKLIPIQSSNLDLLHEQLQDKIVKACILNRKDYQYLEENHKIALLPLGKWHKISGWVSDMGKMVDYFIFVKQ